MQTFFLHFYSNIVNLHYILYYVLSNITSYNSNVIAGTSTDLQAPPAYPINVEASMLPEFTRRHQCSLYHHRAYTCSIYDGSDKSLAPPPLIFVREYI